MYHVPRVVSEIGINNRFVLPPIADWMQALRNSDAGHDSTHLEKYERWLHEWRLHAISLAAGGIENHRFIAGLRTEMSRFVLVSGYLALRGVPPMELTKRALASRYTPGSGAEYLLDFGYMRPNHLDFIDRRGQNDTWPLFDGLRSAEPDSRDLCKAGGLMAIDDQAWWAGHMGEATQGTQEASGLVTCANAAECLIRVPQLLSSFNCRGFPMDPQPAAGVVELLGALNCLGEKLEEMAKLANAEIRRRQGRLIYCFTKRYEDADLTEEEQRLLHEYEMLRETEVHRSQMG
ncbi:hypothetical protein PENSPDRAFT_662523 [Peniophora sp. CONT]|nr:hypothetical protein PENSPDRAFT_662523 [Peniophora sp. CONT]